MAILTIARSHYGKPHAFAREINNPAFCWAFGDSLQRQGKTISEEINQVEGTSINLAKNQSGG
jgi:hypothetical protein